MTAGLSIEQVAERIGYSEASSFVHAFRRWKGVSPRRWAQAARARAGGDGGRPSGPTGAGGVATPGVPRRP